LDIWVMNCVTQMSGPRRRVRRRGFTLIETALATIIVGTGIVATMQLFAACTQQNRNAGEMTTAMMLASNIQEAMIGLSFNDPGSGRTFYGPESGELLTTYDDVDDFDGFTTNNLAGPIDSMRQPIADLSQYQQLVSVWPVYVNQLTANSNESSPDISKTTYTGAVRVRVRILYRAVSTDPATEVYRTSWVRVDY